jgi:tetratricopeptide (TPR) repeat protein
MAEIRLEEAPQGVRTFYDKGIAAMERGNLDYAMDMFEAVLGIEPRLLQVRKLLRAAAVKKAKANPAGRLAVAKAMGGLMKASALLKKNPIQSLEHAEKLLRIDPLNQKFARVQCGAAKAAGLPEVAIQTLEILNDNAPPSLAVLEPLAELYRETEQFDLEFKCRGKIAKLKPNDSEAVRALKDAAARLTMGKAGWQKAESFRDVMRTEAAPGDAGNGIVQALAMVEAEPGNPNLRRSLADLQLQQGLYDDAIQTLETCLLIAHGSDPQTERKLQTAKEHRISFQLAKAEDAADRERVSNLRKQLSDMRMANVAREIERYPNDLQLKFDYGKMLFEAGNHTEAIRHFQLAQRNPQRRVRSLIYLAQAFLAKEQPDIAREQLETALSELPAMDANRKEALYELGAVCVALGDAGKAEQCFREIYAVDIGYRDVAARVEDTAGH